jgi:hypothetical protein
MTKTLKNILPVALLLCLLAGGAEAALEEDFGDGAPLQTGSWSAAAADAKAATAAAAADAAAVAAAAREAGAAAPAAASNSIVVTSLSTCLDKLDPADANEVRTRYVKPYAECQYRLREKLERKAEAKKTAQEAPVAASPRNYLRVQAPDADAEKTSARSTAKQTP